MVGLPGGGEQSSAALYTSLLVHLRESHHKQLYLMLFNTMRTDEV